MTFERVGILELLKPLNMDFWRQNGWNARKKTLLLHLKFKLIWYWIDAGSCNSITSKSNSEIKFHRQTFLLTINNRHTMHTIRQWCSGVVGKKSLFRINNQIYFYLNPAEEKLWPNKISRLNRFNVVSNGDGLVKFIQSLPKNNQKRILESFAVPGSLLTEKSKGHKKSMRGMCVRRWYFIRTCFQTNGV